MVDKQRNEGEGNRTAAREYNRDTQKFVASGKVGQKAEEAARALGGSEKADLQKAEAEGLRHVKEEDRLLKKH